SSFFFFSSRRRHTRLVSDWSSDVCSSDLSAPALSMPTHLPFIVGTIIGILAGFIHEAIPHVDILNAGALGTGAIKFIEIRRVARSEERRVGKECRSRWEPEH